MPTSEQDRTLFKSLAVLSLVLVAIPFLCVKFVPATDLPQHLAQIRLLEEILKNPQQHTYAINWYGANSLIYALLGFNWIIVGHVLAGKLSVIEICLGWCLSIFMLARREHRSPIAAILASIFIFNVCLCWGLLNFLIGFPVFVLWYVRVIDPKTQNLSTYKGSILICCISILLFLAHTLWLAAAVVVLAIFDIRHRLPLKRLALQLIGLLPIGIYTAIWYRHLVDIRTTLRFEMAAQWLTSPFQRLDPSWIVDAGISGIRGPTNLILFLFIVLWIVVSVITQWKDWRSTVNLNLILIGSLFLLYSFLAPDQYANTMAFASRWISIGLVFLVLGAPKPRLPIWFSAVVGILLLTFLSLSTAIQWSRFEARENSGLEESLDKIRNDSRVMGLDFVKTSQFIGGRPFMQTFAYAQVLHGGTLNFSFTEHHSDIVCDAEIDTTFERKHGLEWFAEWVRLRDFQHFDYALVNGDESIHKQFALVRVLEPVTTSGVWRLYHCKNDSVNVRKAHGDSP